MDTQKEYMIPECGTVPDLSQFPLVVGAKQLRKALQKGCAKQVYLAENADPELTEQLAQLCREKAVPYVWACSMQDLGRACGIDVGAAAAAVVD